VTLFSIELVSRSISMSISFLLMFESTDIEEKIRHKSSMSEFLISDSFSTNNGLRDKRRNALSEIVVHFNFISILQIKQGKLELRPLDAVVELSR